MRIHKIQRIVVNGSGPNSGEALIRVADENQNCQSFFMFAPQTHQTNDFLDLLSTAFERMWAETNVKIIAHEYNGDQVADDIENA
jgi:predicted metallopeptidase